MNNRKIIIAGIVVSTFLLSAVSVVQATYIVGAVGVSTTVGDQGVSYDVGNVIDQSGLSVGYNNGEDFDTYVSSATHEWHPDNNEWWTPWDTAGGTIAFDLGGYFTLDKIALWNEDAAGIESMVVSVSGQQFSPTNTGTVVGNFSVTAGDLTDNYYDYPTSQDYWADILSFTEVSSVRYVQFDMIAAQEDALQGAVDPNTGYFTLSMAEVAFSVTDPVPEPTTMVLFISGLVGLVAVRRRNK